MNQRPAHNVRSAELYGNRCNMLVEGDENKDSRSWEVKTKVESESGISNKL